MSLYYVLLFLRWFLALQTGVGVLLCAIGVLTGWEDLRVARVFNGGKRIACESRLRVEGLLFLVFLNIFVLAVWFMSPIDVIMMSFPMIQPIIAARALFNVAMFLLLLMKIVQHRGRHHLETYYDEHAVSHTKAKP